MKSNRQHNSDGTENHTPRVLLVAFNIKGYYSLPIRLLSLIAAQKPAFKKSFDVRFMEFDVNANLEDCIERIGPVNPSIIGMSLNIWNTGPSIQLAKALKRFIPELIILVGGQEVTNSMVDYLALVPAFDYLIDGEGEIPFQQFLTQWDKNARTLFDPTSVSGFRYRHNGKSEYTGAAHTVKSLGDLPSPVLSGLVPICSNQKLGVLLEGARRCPFRCSFCFEGAQKGGVRLAPLEKLTQEIEWAARRGASYFHIMDPILCNSNPERLQLLSSFINELSLRQLKIIFSVEAYAENITKETAGYLNQFSIIDIGLQSFNSSTLKEIHRKNDLQRFQLGLHHLREAGASFNLYLICGLPHETLMSYLHGILFVIKEKPSRMFLNELCLLNGTELRKRASEYGYGFDPDPPYKVQYTKWMSRRELKIAQSLSKVVELQYNLSSKGVYNNIPWVKTEHAVTEKKVAIRIGGNCSWRCPGCAAWQETAPSPSEYRMLDQVHNCNVDIHLGNHVNRSNLFQLIGQLQLAGAGRIKLVAPIDIFYDRSFVTLLIRRGIWQFKTFIGSLPDADLHAVSNENVNISDALDHFSSTFFLHGQAEIRPFLEVMIVSSKTKPVSPMTQIRFLLSHDVSMISLSQEGLEGDGQWVDSLVDDFEEMVSPRSWIKIPETILRNITGDIQNLDEIMGLMSHLNLISGDPDAPPCYQNEHSSDTRV